VSAPILGRGQFAVADWWRAGVHLGIVTSVEDPDRKGRVQIKLPAIDPTGEAKIWARVAVPYAGNNFGAFLIPGVDAEVLVAFVAGDAGWPIVIGCLWNGATGMPERLPGSTVDRWTLTGKNGSRIAIVEEQQGQEKIEIQLPSGQVSATLTDASGGEITLKVAGNTLKLSSSGISIKSSGTFSVQAGGSMTVAAPSVTVTTPNATFSQKVTSIDIQATSIISANYSHGVGNVW
jgi:uncharacterized protein involved in type VI secretion and phage assembly